MAESVPVHFERLGYSGLFTLDVPLSEPDDRASVAALRARVPYETGGWLVLRVNDEGTATIVRRDAAALCELAIR